MKIKEVVQKYGLPASTLRYYEKIGLLNPVKRNNGVREYQEEDLNHLDFILCMKESQMSLEMIKHYFDLYNLGPETLEQRLDLLKQQRELTEQKQQEIQKTLDYIDYKIQLTEKNLAEHQEIVSVK